MLIFVRHGRSTGNAADLLVGQADVPLDDHGLAQIDTLAHAVGHVDRVVCSPLQRCRVTAAVLGLPVEIDDRIIEVDYGSYDLTRLGDVPADVWNQWRTDLDFVPPNGESMRAMGTRVREFCDEISAAAITLNIAVVCHVSPIKAAVAWALGVGDATAWRLYVDQASITRIAVTTRGVALHSFNETNHLASLDRGQP